MISNAIIACSSTELSKEECALFAQMQPWGLILFSRNIHNPAQVVQLIKQMKHALGRDNLMVFIDQEGGRVSRLPASHWRIPPSPTSFSNIFSGNPDIGKRACFLNALLTGLELKALGINANCTPMIDLPQQTAANIISKRALGSDPQQVIDLARQVVNGLKRAGVAPVIKHMPGHGRATCDSHLELPTVDASLDELIAYDFVPFQALSDETMAMTAHVLYNQIDQRLPATVSPIVIDRIMRNTINFDGLIMTDDINMKALTGTVAQRAEKAIKAGCDIALHCSGDLAEMQSLMDVLSPLEGKSLLRAQAAQKIAFSSMPDINESDIALELKELLATYS